MAKKLPKQTEDALNQALDSIAEIEPIVQPDPLPGQQELPIEEGDAEKMSDPVANLQRDLLKCGVKLERETLASLEMQALQWLETFAEHTLGLPDGSEIVIHWLATLLMEREEMARRLVTLQRRCDNLEEARTLANQQRVLELEIEDMSEELKEKKSKHKQNAHRLEKLVVEQDQATFQFETPEKPASDAVQTTDPEYWRKLPIDSLKAHGISDSLVEKLVAALDTDTLGTLQDLMTKHGEFWPKHIKGVGPEKAAAITEAFNALVAAHTTFEPPADNEAANRRDVARLDELLAACNEILEHPTDFADEAFEFAESVHQQAASMRLTLVDTGCGATINQTRAIDNWHGGVNRWLENVPAA